MSDPCAKIDSDSGSSPMSCEDVRDLLYLYLCDELDDEEFAEVGQHLTSCENCRAAMSETVILTGTLTHSLPKIPQNYYSRNN